MRVSWACHEAARDRDLHVCGSCSRGQVLVIACFAPWVYAAYRLFFCRVMTRTEAHEYGIQGKVFDQSRRSRWGWSHQRGDSVCIGSARTMDILGNADRSFLRTNGRVLGLFDVSEVCWHATVNAQSQPWSCHAGGLTMSYSITKALTT